MLTIKNISRILGLSIRGRRIIEVDRFKDRLDPDKYHSFTIEGIYDNKEYNREHYIVLTRTADTNGKYRLFNMGLQLCTDVEFDKYVISDPLLLCEKMRDVMRKTEEYYKTN